MAVNIDHNKDFEDIIKELRKVIDYKIELLMLVKSIRSLADSAISDEALRGVVKKTIDELIERRKNG